MPTATPELVDDRKWPPVDPQTNGGPADLSPTLGRRFRCESQDSTA